jgi:hypothetical protein
MPEWCKASDRAGLERLHRYILRPPLAKDRLQRRDDGSVVVGLKRVWSGGTSTLVFSPSELVERRVALGTPPRAKQLIYRGVVAGSAAWCGEVDPTPAPESPEAAKARRAKRLTRHPRMRFAGEREDAGPGAKPWARRGERPSSGSVHRVAAPRRDGRRG